MIPNTANSQKIPHINIELFLNEGNQILCYMNRNIPGNSFFLLAICLRNEGLLFD